jgi:hypothetical protein
MSPRRRIQIFDTTQLCFFEEEGMQRLNRVRLENSWHLWTLCLVLACKTLMSYMDEEDTHSLNHPVDCVFDNKISVHVVFDGDDLGFRVLF